MMGHKSRLELKGNINDVRFKNIFIGKSFWSTIKRMKTTWKLCHYFAEAKDDHYAKMATKSLMHQNHPKDGIPLHAFVSYVAEREDGDSENI